MAILPVRVYPDEVLATVAEPIVEIDEKIRKLAGDMAETMYAAPGVGLAANQVGVAKRLIVIDVGDPEIHEGLITIVNPDIVAKSDSIDWEEGCLSVPNINEDVTRAKNITVKGLDLDGNEQVFEASDLFAVVFQHEIDHLNGILFWDHLSSLKRGILRRKLKKELADQE